MQYDRMLGLRSLFVLVLPCDSRSLNHAMPILMHSVLRLGRKEMPLWASIGCRCRLDYNTGCVGTVTSLLLSAIIHGNSRREAALPGLNHWLASLDVKGQKAFSAIIHGWYCRGGEGKGGIPNPMASPFASRRDEEEEEEEESRGGVMNRRNNRAQYTCESVRYTTKNELKDPSELVSP
ncbi:uncharacterized protein LY89DRAFT_682764 [Mollisia scopiformis]|uniref:Uncharacterized protein n=1 Tax=Mollisia scopiformis TaxID=149040 RepID=A0A194XJJ4_MOLSC|nr:uncharacterized protein LY89DRAFT_682764 [Mollisia scopiformis]KUJ19937.1 hypothetical protein LY89DRAFT_682764 [Mollisia scopiformis]